MQEAGRFWANSLPPLGKATTPPASEESAGPVDLATARRRAERVRGWSG